MENNECYQVEEKIESEICSLKKIIQEKKKKLFMIRIKKILDIKNNFSMIEGINYINFTSEENNKWCINYTHLTNNFDTNNYNYNIDSDIETESKIKKTNVYFGKSKKYYLKGVRSNQFKIYRNSKKQLRILNSDYNIELDLDEQYELITKYSKNYDIAEWLALRVFIFIAENEWSDENFVTHFSSIL